MRARRAHMAELGEFFHMGGYAFYVWTSYALFVVVLTLNVAAPIRRAREVRRRLAAEARFGSSS